MPNPDVVAHWHTTARGDNVERMAGLRVTWRDVQTMPDDGNRYEAIDGEMYLTPAPSVRHQLVSMKLADALLQLLVHSGHGLLVSAPVGVEFLETAEGVQPDLVFISTARLNIAREDSVQGAPDLVIEILSPRTARRDRTIKLQLYRRQRVAEYWIVDMDVKQIEVWRLAHGATEAERYTDSVPVRLGRQTIGSIELAKVFDWPP